VFWLLTQVVKIQSAGTQNWACTGAPLPGKLGVLAPSETSDRDVTYAASGTRHDPRIPWIGGILMNDLFVFAVSHPTALMLFATMMFKAGRLSA
jgi:hypothetical protein